eukprot:7316263-Alexandrium_andersonii.AAC.1
MPMGGRSSCRPGLTDRLPFGRGLARSTCRGPAVAPTMSRRRLGPPVPSGLSPGVLFAASIAYPSRCVLPGGLATR